MTLRLPYLIFSDGNGALLADIKSNTEIFYKDGQAYYKFKMRLSESLKAKYKIADRDLDPRFGGVEMVYKKEYCYMINQSSDNPVWLLLCDFKGEPIGPVYEINKDLLTELELKTRENESLRSLIARTQEMMQEIVEHPQDFNRRYLKNLEEMKKILGNVDIVPMQQGGALIQQNPQG